MHQPGRPVLRTLTWHLASTSTLSGQSDDGQPYDTCQCSRLRKKRRFLDRCVMPVMAPQARRSPSPWAAHPLPSRPRRVEHAAPAKNRQSTANPQPYCACLRVGRTLAGSRRAACTCRWTCLWRSKRHRRCRHDSRPRPSAKPLGGSPADDDEADAAGDTAEHEQDHHDCLFSGPTL